MEHSLRTARLTLESYARAFGLAAGVPTAWTEPYEDRVSAPASVQPVGAAPPLA